MKKLILSALILGALVSCRKTVTPPVTPPVINPVVPEVVAKENHALFMDFTATWCNPCGTWGMPNFIEVYEANKSKCIALAVHTSNQYPETAQDPKSHDEFYNSTTAGFINKSLASNAFSPRAYPDWYVNQTYGEVIVSGGGVDIEGSKENSAKLINDFYATPVIASTKITKTFDSAKINVRTLTQFFTDVTGEYTLSTYLVEDKVVWEQAQNGYWNNKYEHNHLLRTHLSKTVWGTSLGTDLKNDKQVELKFTGDISKYNQANLHVVTVIWKKVGLKYTFVNASID